MRQTRGHFKANLCKTCFRDFPRESEPVMPDGLDQLPPAKLLFTNAEA